MKRIHRYLLLELLQNSAITFTVVVAVFFLLALALVMGSTRTEGVPFWVVLQHTAFTAVANLFLAVPMTVLTASLFTYGRAQAEGEFTAMRVAGIHPRQVILPALVFGAASTLLLGWLQDELMPGAHFQARLELGKDVLRNLEGLLKRETSINEKGWRALWGARGVDSEGHLILYDLELFELDPRGEVKAHTYAASARPSLDTRNSVFTLELKDLRRRAGANDHYSARNLSLELPLDAFASNQTLPKRDRDRSYEELITRCRRLQELPSSPIEARKQQKQIREASTDYHFRVAFAFSSVLFALFGATLGLYHGLGNRVLVFIVGFLAVVALYYPLEMLGSWLGSEGHVPASVALWIGNVVLLVLALRIFREVLRT